MTRIASHRIASQQTASHSAAADTVCGAVLHRLGCKRKILEWHLRVQVE